MTVAAYSSTVKAGGTPTTTTGEAMTDGGAHTVYQITSTSKRIVDPATAITVYVNTGGGPVAAVSTTYTFDYLFGTATFAVANGPTDVVTIDCKYIPTLSLGGAREFSIEEKNTMQDVTPFNTGDAWRRKLKTLEDATVTLSDFDTLKSDVDPGAGSTVLLTARRDGTPLLVEIRPGGSGQYWRGWMLIENNTEKGGIEGVLDSSLNFTSAPVLGTGRTDTAGFGWGS